MHRSRLLIMLLSAFLITIIAFSSCMTSRGEGALSVSTVMGVEPSPTYTLLGGTLTVNITVANVSDCAGAEFRLYWLREKLNGTSIAEGPFIKQAGSTYFSIINFTDNYNSTCGLAWVSTVLLGPGPGAYGSGTVASISFKTKNTGSTGLWLSDTELVDSASPPNFIPHIAISGIAYITFHSVAVAGVTPSTPVLGQGYTMSINVTAKNQGNYTETFKVTVFANATSIASQNITLSIGNSATTTFVWNTAGFHRGRYTIKVQVALPPGETNTANNTYTGGGVEVRLRGDVNGDGYVTLADVGKLDLIFSEVYPYKCPPYDLNNPETYYYLPNPETGIVEHLMPDINGDGKVNLADVGKLDLIFSGFA
jgi:hypothetical protein